MASRLCKGLFKNIFLKNTRYLNSRTIADFQPHPPNEDRELKVVKKLVKNISEEHSYFPITSADYGYSSFSYYDVERNMTKLRKLQPTNKLISRMFHTCSVTNKDTLPNDLREPLKKEVLDDLKLNEPLKYSTSKAQDHSAIESLLPKQKARPKWEATSVLISTVSFLIYWGYLREENDWDEMVYAPIYDKVPYLEENQLEAAITHNKSAGLKSEELKEKLREVRAKRLELERLSKEK